MTDKPTHQYRLEMAVRFLLLHAHPLHSATEISADPEMARRVIIALATVLADTRIRAGRQLVTDRPATVEELDDMLGRACAWATEVTDKAQP